MFTPLHDLLWEASVVHQVMWCFIPLWYIHQLHCKCLHSRLNFYILGIMLNQNSNNLNWNERWDFFFFSFSLKQVYSQFAWRNHNISEHYKWLFYRKSMWAESVLKIEQTRTWSFMPWNFANNFSCQFSQSLKWLHKWDSEKNNHWHYEEYFPTTSEMEETYNLSSFKVLEYIWYI